MGKQIRADVRYENIEVRYVNIIWILQARRRWRQYLKFTLTISLWNLLTTENRVQTWGLQLN